MSTINLESAYVHAAKAEDFIPALADASVDLVLIDPPYYGIVDDAWDNQWPSSRHYLTWLGSLVVALSSKMTPTASLLMFGGVGKHQAHPLFTVMAEVEQHYTYRNWITWKKRRAYGKSHDYLFCREEILWFSKSPARKDVTFNVPLLAERRGYAGFSAKYPAKSEFKRVSNVWDDIPELMQPERSCQKPLPLITRLIETHSNPGQLVVDVFAGWGTTGVAAIAAGRQFLGCEAIEGDAHAANERCERAVPF